MLEVQNYIDAFTFVIARTDILTRLGWTLVGSMILGTFLDRFKAWIWVVFLLGLLVFTAWQISSMTQDLGFTPLQAMIPHILFFLTGFTFITGSGLGYYVKIKFLPKYAKQRPAEVANDVLLKVNGGDTGKSEHNPTVILE